MKQNKYIVQLPFQTQSCLFQREINKVLKRLCVTWNINALTEYSFWQYSSLRQFSKRGNLFLMKSICLLCMFLNCNNRSDSWCNTSWLVAPQEPCAPLTAAALPLFSLDWFKGDSRFGIFAPFFTWEPTCPSDGKFMKGVFNSWQMTFWIFRSLSSTISDHFPYPCLNRKELC